MNSTRYLILFSALTILSGCGPGETDTANPKLLVVNVLDKELYDDCHIKGSIHVPFDQVTQQLGQYPKETEIVVYCSNYRCNSSHYAVKQLQEQGFTKSAVFEGGMAEWFQKGYPVEGGHTKTYLTKKIEKSDLSAHVPTITINELAEKLGVAA